MSWTSSGCRSHQLPRQPQRQRPLRLRLGKAPPRRWWGQTSGSSATGVGRGASSPTLPGASYAPFSSKVRQQRGTN